MNTSAMFPNRLRYQHIAFALLIVFLAYFLRVTVIVQRAAADDQFFPHDGSDPNTYIEQAHGILDGTFPLEDKVFFFHPGPPYVVATIFRLVGDSVPMLYLTIALLDSLTVGWLIACGWLLTQRTIGGYLAGLIYALYPSAIFYGTTGVTEVQAMACLAPFIFLTLWQREKLVWWRTPLMGIFAGIMSLIRVNFLPFVGLSALWILLVCPAKWRIKIIHVVLLLLVTAATISPATLHNYRATDKFIPVVNIGSMELYWANNRDSAGRNDLVPAVEAIDMSYESSLQRDIRFAPLRFISLLGYKLALFWNHLEVPNNANFYRGQEASFILQIIPLNFTILAVFGLLGLAALWHEDKATFLYLGVMDGWMVTTFLMVWIYGRLRHPAAVPLSLLTAYLVVRVIDGVRHGINIPQLFKRYLLPAIGIIALVIFSNWTLYPLPKLPIKREYRQLPSDAIALDVQFEDVRLVGWRPLPQYWSAASEGYVPVYESYVVELFWEVIEATETQYNFYIAYIDNEQRYTGVDRPIGAVSFPHRTTNTWQIGMIHGEVVGFRVDDDVPQERSGQVRIGVWTVDEAGNITNISTADNQGFFVLDTLAVFNPYVEHEVPALPASDIVFGEMIALRGYDMPETAAPNETISLQFHWEALRDVPDNYTLFLHVVDETETIVGQTDPQPVPQLITDNWIADYPLYAELSLTMPDTIGTYLIYAGLYNTAGRLAVDAPDNRILLGEVTVEN
jgi:4-amino-4-deoxy-L-arabinose transferase-like glycosyltransferase